MIKICFFCKKEYKSKPSTKRKFCTRACLLAWGEQCRTFNCYQCGIKVVLKKGEFKKTRRHFCTRACFDKFQIGPNNVSWKGIKRSKSCINCKKEFIVKNTTRLNQKFCSMKCRNLILKGTRHSLYQNIIDKCAYCKKEFRITKCKLGKRNFCDRECANLGHSKYIRGKNNGRYMHGDGDGPYPSNWNKRFKSAIRERDGNICRICNMTEQEHGKLLCVHHIDYNKENLDPFNLITVCRFCHGKMHGGSSQRKIWKEKLSKMLES